MAGTDLVTEAQIDSLTTNIATAVKANATAIGTKTDDSAVTAHVNDTTAAHAASSISIADVGTIYTATDVEAALAEVKALADAAVGSTDDTTVNNHIADATDAHDASAISIADAGALYTATNVEAALAEVKALADNVSGNAVDILITDAGGNYTATNVETALAEVKVVADGNTDDSAVTTHIGDASGAHAASAISFADVAGDYTATDVEAALAEVRVIADAAAGGGVAINDSLTNGTDAWSSSKIDSEISTAVSNLINAAPGALDTLNELAAAIGDDANFASTVTTGLNNRLRVDTAAQGLTGTQQTNAKTNLGIASSTQNFASDFNTAIA